MSTIKDLPSPNSSFKATIGPGSFAKKLNRVTMAGDMSHLRDNRDSLVKVIKKNETAIKRGAFNRYRQLNAIKNVKQMEGANLSKIDLLKIKKIFKYLSGSEKNSASSDASKVKIDKALDKDVGFLEKRWQERKAKMSAKMDRFSKARTGGEAEMKFINEPKTQDRDEKYSVSSRVISRRFQTQEQKLQKRLPSHLVNWEEERSKRFEVSSLSKKNNKDKASKATVKDSGDDINKHDLYQNL